MKRYDYDLLVIGGGIAGFASSLMANGLGKRVAIVEKGKLGGNCTWSTCIPSKALIRAASVAYHLKGRNIFGLSCKPSLEINSDKVMSYVRSVVEKVYNLDLPESFERIGIKILNGEPEFIDSHRIRLDGRVLSARNFIIATGSRAFVPPIEGVDEIPYLTNETIFNLDVLPGSMIVLGGGPAGIEFAQAFVRLGMEITVVEMADRILVNDDEELVAMLTRQLKAEGVKILTDNKAMRFAREKDKIALNVQDKGGNTRQIKAEAVLIAVGRKANVEGLSLERAGVKYTAKGIITNRRLQTSARNIYACGDVVGPYQFAAMAEYQATIAANNILLPVKKSVDYRSIAWVTFTDPPLAHVGLTEEKARRLYGDRIRVYRYDYRRVRRALADSTDTGLSKFILDTRGKIIGASIWGHRAEDLIHEVQLLKSLNQPLAKVHSVVHTYPTYSEAIVKHSADMSYTDTMRHNPFIKLALKLLPNYRDNLDSLIDKL